MARLGVFLGLGARSVGVVVPRATEKWPESRPGYCLWSQDWPQPAGLVTTDTSRPMTSEGGPRRHIELGLRGAPDEVPSAIEELRRGVTEVGGTWAAHPAPPSTG